MSTVPEKRRYTLQEYVVLEAAAQTKSEFYRGEIFAMAGATPRHNRIVTNLISKIQAIIEGSGCEVYGSDQRIWINPVDLSTYADLVIICGPMERDAADRIAATNPRVVIEVLSPCTEKYDRGKKFEFYQRLDSLNEYLLVAQDEPVITQLVRDDRAWRYSLVSGMEADLQFATIPVQLPFIAIYRGVTFGPSEDD